MLKNIKAVLFDLDGTLVDSMWMWDKIDHDFLAERGIEHPSNLSRQINGLSYTETAQFFIDRFHLTESIDELKAIWNQMAEDNYKYRVHYKKGAEEFLKLLKSRGVLMGIATSNSPHLAGVVFDRYQMGDYISCLLTSCQVAHGKPSPDVYLETASRLGVKPEECLVFEDAIKGVQAGLNAGMRVCAIYDRAEEVAMDEIKEIADDYCMDFEEFMQKYA